MGDINSLGYLLEWVICPECGEGGIYYLDDDYLGCDNCGARQDIEGGRC